MARSRSNRPPPFLFRDSIAAGGFFHPRGGFLTPWWFFNAVEAGS
jgi:hypothetical protein